MAENSRIGITYVIQIRRAGLYLVQQYDRIGGRAVVGIYIVDVFGRRINAERIDDEAARADAAAIVQNLRTTLKLGKLRASEPIALVNDISRTSHRHSSKSEREAKQYGKNYRCNLFHSSSPSHSRFAMAYIAVQTAAVAAVISAKVFAYFALSSGRLPTNFPV